MKIALLGYGKMGQLIAKLAPKRNHQIIICCSQKSNNVQESLTLLEKADVIIDFSDASVVDKHVELCISLNKPLIIGTTGWDTQLENIRSKILNSGQSCLYAPNFSIGIYLYKKIVGYAASLFEPSLEYDVSGIEYHHNQKKDQPSGTAHSLTEEIHRHMPYVHGFNFTSVRCGHIPGTHTLLFDSLVDTITLTHEARSREGFALGALLAAEWIIDQKGFFSFEQMMQIKTQVVENICK
jgi:4-hydroxy-tetrahydrodipicolinate reductase